MSKTPETENNYFNDTPEVNALLIELRKPCDGDRMDMISLARKLEIERDEARNRLVEFTRFYDISAASLREAITERDQLREVADELANKMSFIQKQIGIGQVSHAMTRILDTTLDAANSYNSLPHVIERNKAK